MEYGAARHVRAVASLRGPPSGADLLRHSSHASFCVPARLAGQKEQEANNYLEKRYKADPNPQLSYDDTVQLALACLQNVLGSDLKAPDVEAFVVKNDSLKFSPLSNEEIEAQLTALAERDDEIGAKE